MENVGAVYNISQSLPAARFTNPAPRNTKNMGYEIKGNQPPKRGKSPDIFGTPIGPEVSEGNNIAEGFQDYSGEARMPEFDLGRNSNPEQIPSESGPGTSEPAEMGEESSAAGDVAGIAEALI